MISRDDIKSDIDSIIQKQMESLKGHFNPLPDDLQNKKYGVDIFTITIKGSKENRYLYLSGLYKKGIKDLLTYLGIFMKTVHGSSILIRKTHNIIEQVSIKQVKDLICWYLFQLKPLNIELENINEEFSVNAQTEIFLQQCNTVINQNFLEYLLNEDSEILRDDKSGSYLMFNNKIIRVESEQIKTIQYSEIQAVVWKSSIVNFNFTTRKDYESHFEKFIKNVCSNDEERIKCLKSALGYLIYSYNKPSGGQMVMLYDESITDLNNPMGGTGKGVIAKAISTIRNTTKLDGKKFSGKQRFDFQEVTLDTQVVWLDDAGKDLDIDRFNSISTDGITIEKKFQDAIHIPAENSPKFLICSNIILDVLGSTRKRRQYIVELSDHYSSQIVTGVEEPIIKEHGGRFYSDDWNEEEWNAFYWYLIECVQTYLKYGLPPSRAVNIYENRSRQQIGEELHNWIEEHDFEVGKDYNTKELFNEFKGLHENSNDLFTQRAFSNRLKMFFALKNLKVEFKTVSEGKDKVSVFRINNQ